MPSPRVLIVAENVSARLGGEAFLPLHYFRVLRSRGIDAFLLTHERVKDELTEAFPTEVGRMRFILDTPLQVSLWKAGKRLPRRIDVVSFNLTRQWILHGMMRKEAKRLVAELGIDVVHQPTPVSPRQPSRMYDLGAPVVIGPLNGNMDYPPAFAAEPGRFASMLTSSGRSMAGLANQISPGKLRAAAILVANPRTQAGLPPNLGNVPVIELVENGVDLARFAKVERNNDAAPRLTDAPQLTDAKSLQMAFVGRLVDWKAVDLLLQAMADLPKGCQVQLHVLGDGAERPKLEALAQDLGLAERVSFVGFIPQQEVSAYLERMDTLVLPSLFECGGAVVLEAMAKNIPVIATNWGGPADYLDASCGILVDPDGRDSFILGLRNAIVRLARDPKLRQEMGKAGREKVEREYDWERKVDRMLQIYSQVATDSRAS